MTETKYWERAKLLHNRSKLMKRFTITTLGCKVNQYESASFQSSLEEQKCTPAAPGELADIVVINTCCVTARGAQQSRQEISRAARENPEARIVITGCYAQLEPETIAAIPELQGRSYAILGNTDKDRTSQEALEESNPKILCNPIEKQKEIANLPISHFHGRTRAPLKIQDGCNAFCTYCIVPYTRGRSRSLPREQVLQQARTYAAQGFKEIIITGIHVGNYGRDLCENEDIVSIIARLCEETPDIRYRLSSIEPMEVSDRLIDCINSHENFMPHLHIPLQSAESEILSRMNRRYSTETFAEIIRRCHGKVAGLAVGVDILAGFPGETDEHFARGLTFLEALPFTYLHVFPYSRRQGTPAAKMQAQIPGKTKKERVRQLRALSDSKRRQFYDTFLGTIRPVLLESHPDRNGNLRGFTDNYIAVTVPERDQNGQVNANTVVPVLLQRRTDNCVAGTIVCK